MIFSSRRGSEAPAMKFAHSGISCQAFLELQVAVQFQAAAQQQTEVHIMAKQSTSTLYLTSVQSLASLPDS